MEDKFIEFLQSNQAYNAYIKNLWNHHHATIEGVMRRNSESKWVKAAFDWSASPEGNDYWVAIDKAWQKIVEPSVINPIQNVTEAEQFMDEV